MGFFKSISNWIFGEERQELKKEIEALNKNMNALLDLLIEEKQQKNKDVTPEKEEPKTLYKSMKKIGGNTIVVLHNGEILSTEKDVYDTVKTCNTVEQIKFLFIEQSEIKNETTSESDFHEKQIQEKEEKFVNNKNNFEIFFENEDFEIVENGIKLVGTNSVIPPLILADFVEICEKLKYIAVSGDKKKYNEEELLKKYYSLVGFWQKLSKSPLSYRENVLRYCKNNDIRLDKHGHIIGYRRIRTYKKEGKVVQAAYKYNDANEKDIISEYNRIRGQKKGTGSFSFVEFKDGSKKAVLTEKVKNLTKEDRVVGNLKSLYEAISNKEIDKEKKVKEKTLYTSDTNYGKHVFAIGDVYCIPQNEINVDAGNCAAGGLKYVASF